MLNARLKGEMLKKVLKELLDFDVLSEDNIDIIYDEEGNEFYGTDANDKFDLYTLNGIIKYIEHLAEMRGKRTIQYEIKRTLGIS